MEHCRPARCRRSEPSDWARARRPQAPVRSRRGRARRPGVSPLESAGAADWIAANWPVPEVRKGSRMNRYSRHARCDFFQQLQPFHADAEFEASELRWHCQQAVKGWSTKPAPTGSGTCANTIGTVRAHLQRRAPQSRCRCSAWRPAPARPIPPHVYESLAVTQRVSIRRVAAVAPAQLLQGLCERREARSVLPHRPRPDT